MNWLGRYVKLNLNVNDKRTSVCLLDNLIATYTYKRSLFVQSPKRMLDIAAITPIICMSKTEN